MKAAHIAQGDTLPTKKERDMKSYQLTLVTVLAFFCAVTFSEATSGGENGESSKQERKDFERAAVVFQRAAEKYPYAKREQFIAEMKLELKEANVELEALSIVEGFKEPCIKTQKGECNETRI